MPPLRRRRKFTCPWRQKAQVHMFLAPKAQADYACSTSSYNSRASPADPRRRAKASTRTTLTALPPAGIVRTSPHRTLACGLSVACRLIRTSPLSAMRAQLSRCDAKRAHHSHLSSR